MDIIVHFVVGLTFGLVVLLFVDWPQPREFLFIFASGLWAIIPDGHWMFSEFGFDGPAAVWKSFHQTAFANLFWFHRFLDNHETGRKNLEAGTSLLLLFVAVVTYYVANDWEIVAESESESGSGAGAGAESGSEPAPEVESSPEPESVTEPESDHEAEPGSESD
ncbi:hypothetical protein BRC93_02075 [Halobacteriales archaeon QS_5_70_15]|nr:MAG: hypothetical protein BRC93_02075 [Halobacteriales archaeon QS_5_70_15]